MRVQETCVCSADIEVDSSDTLEVLEEVRKWRARHSGCVIEGIGPYPMKFVGRTTYDPVMDLLPPGFYDSCPCDEVVR